MDKVRILHTSDVHIGAPFEFLGARGGRQRRAVRETFESITGMASRQGFHVLLIAGDLFDSAYSVAESDLSFVLKCLSGAGAGCRIVILPGSHDYLAPGSIFERERERFESAGNTRIVTFEDNIVKIPELSLAVHGCPLNSPHTSKVALSDLVPLVDFDWNVAVAHGSVEGASAASEPEDNPIDPCELDGRFDYLALGHWHSFNMIREGGPPVVYCGSPELIARDQKGAGSVVSLTLSTGAAEVERIRVGKRRVEGTVVDCTGMVTTEEIYRKVIEQRPADEDLVLDLTVKGILGSESAVDMEMVREMLLEHFFSVKFSGSGPAREISGEDIGSIPEGTVAGRFVRILHERISGASGEERELLEEALQLGCQLFLGRNPLE